MGMAATQLRYLFLENRFEDNLFRLTKLTNQKTALTKEMKNLSANYNAEKNKKVLKWYNNGNNYIDITYNNLMSPSVINQESPNLITDMSGKVVINSKLKEYAEMISPNGKPTNNWEDVRTEVLSAITGIPANRIDNYGEAICSTFGSVESLNEATINLAEVEARKPVRVGSIYEFMSAAGVSVSGNVPFFIPETLNMMIDNLVSAFSVLVDDPENMKHAGETFKEYAAGISNSNSETTLSMENAILMIMGMYHNAGGSAYNAESGSLSWIDKNNSYYSTWEAEYQAALAEYNAAVENYNNASAFENEYFTNEDELKLAFYDSMFSAIAERGWVYNYSVEDPEYLNEMLQNNMYTITTNNRTAEFNPLLDKIEYDNDYMTNIASNMTTVVAVNDTEYEERAQMEYIAEKENISHKESMIDNQMSKIKTEQSAIQTRMQALEKTLQKSIERTMNITG